MHLLPMLYLLFSSGDAIQTSGKVMLQNSFFYFTEPLAEGNFVKTTIELNEAHGIFQGHFPGQPVVPGVCMIQMVKEVVEKMIGKDTRLMKADNIKFLALTDPARTSTIHMELKINRTGEMIKVDAQLIGNGTVIFKFKGTFISR